jgi:hypothetical protein
MKNETTRTSEPCTHPVPVNNFGIFAMHSLDNRALPVDAVQNILKGPVTGVQALLDREHAKVEHLGDDAS